jgi:hypothetical protein
VLALLDPLPQERQSTAQLPMSNGAPPAASGTTWSTVRSLAAWASRWWPGHQLPRSPRQARSTRALSRCQAGVLYRALCLLRLECRAWSVQRLPGRLVTTPQTVQSFTRESSIRWLARSIRSRCYACGTNPRSAPGVRGPFASRHALDQRLR